MNYAGIDIGSRSIEVVMVNDGGEIVASRQADTTFDPIGVAHTLLEGLTYQRIMATGYGRTLFEVAFDTDEEDEERCGVDEEKGILGVTPDLSGQYKPAPTISTVTEIKAHARGAKAIFPNFSTLLDIGGQDSKAIAVNEKGRVKKFEMNDRCAAGTGKFLEIMAKTLGFSIKNFGDEALSAETALSINSMCTVFAESEVTSLIAKGAKTREIARGLHVSVVKRAAAMINRVRSSSNPASKGGDIVFTGGVANNPCMVRLISEKLACDVKVPENPQMMGAYGAALLSMES